MEECSSIEEVMESSRCSGDGVSVTETTKLETEPLEDGPWNELSVANRHRKMLETGFMADITIRIQEEKFRCHSFILSSASPQLAALISENSHELCLPDVEPQHFRLLLEIVYTDVAKSKIPDANEVLGIARAAHKLRIPVAVAYCSKILKKQVTVTNVLPILEFALLVDDKNLTKICTKVIRTQASTVLKSDHLKHCELSVLELILSDDALHEVTELDLFQACVTWTETREDPRLALGSTLGLIRFHLFTAQQFAKHVKPTKLLSGSEESDIFSCLVTHEGDMPAGFSNEKRARGQLEKSALEIQIPLYWTGIMKNVTTEELATNPPLRFSLSADGYIQGVQVSNSSTPEDATKFPKDMTLTLQSEEGKSLATAKFNPISNGAPRPDLKFSEPVIVTANVIYSLHITGFQFDGRQCISGRKKQSYFTNAGLEINILEDAYTIISPLLQLTYCSVAADEKILQSDVQERPDCG